MIESRKKDWNTRAKKKEKLLNSVDSLVEGLVIPTQNIVKVLEMLINPGDRVVLEGNNQKQASFLSESLLKVNNEKVHDLHMIMSSISRPEHLDIFEKKIAEKIDFAFSGPQSLRIAQMLEDNQLTMGQIHTYVELYGRLFVDLIPNVSLVAADQADINGNLYTGANTEETPTLIEAAAFSDGIVIVQVNELVDELPRVDIPGSWVDFVVVADEPYELEPLFTRDPRFITEIQILQAMMVIKGIYAEHSVMSLNHGIGFNTAAIELLLPTYGESLGLKGKICKHWTLNPHPTLIPAIESGWVESIHSFGGEVGMENYIKARQDVFFTGKDGSMRSNRTLCQLAGQYAVDLFIGSSLQIDEEANSSTVVKGRLAGYGGAPNMGHNPGGRRHSSKAWLNMKTDDGPLARGKKLVVQVVETFQEGNKPVFVESLDAIDLKDQTKLDTAPIMIYGEDVTHIVTEEGIAYLFKAKDLDERREMISAIAGVTPFGLKISLERKVELRKAGLVALPEDLGIKQTDAKRSLLAAKSVEELVEWSDGLYEPPARFRSW